MYRFAALFFLLYTFCAFSNESNEVDKTSNIIVVQNVEKKSNVLAIDEFHTNYILFGEPDTKVQLSFQHQILKKANLHFAYIQQMFWEITKKSAPFSDVNYNPQFFYRYEGLEKEKNFNLELGLSHLSNGKGDQDSRSIDWLFSRFIFGEKLVSSINLKFYYNEESTNKDYTDFVGPFEFNFRFNNIFSSAFNPKDFYLRVYTAGKFGEKLDKTSFEIGLRYRFFNDRASPSLFLQYFRGYGEKFLDYNQLTTSYRAGLSIGGDYRSRL